MYFPKFEYTSQFVAKLLKLENARTILQTTDLAYEAKTKLKNKAKSHNLFHVTSNLDTSMSLSDTEKVVLGTKPDIADEVKKQVIINFRNASEFIRSEDIKNYRELDNIVLQEINKILVFNWKETWDAKYRNFNERLDESFDPLSNLRDTDIKGHELELIMNELIEWYRSAAPTVAPIIRIGVVLFRMLEVAPFIAANTYTTLIALDHLLLTHGYSTKVYSSAIAKILSSTDGLSEAFTKARESEELSGWLEWFIDILLEDLTATRESMNDVLLEDQKSKRQPFLDLNQRQMKILKYLQTVPTVKREEYCNIMDVSTMTAFRDLKDLLRKKLIKTEGRGRGTKYRLANY